MGDSNNNDRLIGPPANGVRMMRIGVLTFGIMVIGGLCAIANAQHSGGGGTAGGTIVSPGAFVNRPIPPDVHRPGTQSAHHRSTHPG
jgi:hypothetical protein